MPFWARLIGAEDTNLFHMRTNLRFDAQSRDITSDIVERVIFPRAGSRFTGSLGKPGIQTWFRAAWGTQLQSYPNYRLAQNPEPGRIGIGGQLTRPSLPHHPAGPFCAFRALEPHPTMIPPPRHTRLRRITTHLPWRHRPLGPGKGNLGAPNPPASISQGHPVCG